MSATTEHALAALATVTAFARIALGPEAYRIWLGAELSVEALRASSHAGPSIDLKAEPVPPPDERLGAAADNVLRLPPPKREGPKIVRTPSPFFVGVPDDDGPRVA